MSVVAAYRMHQTAAAVVMWCGMMLKDSACNIDIMDNLAYSGPQWFLSLAGLFGAVHHRKMAQATSLACWHGGGHLIVGEVRR